MLYTLPELVAELGVPFNTLLNWLDIGAPHIRNNRGHIYIHGLEFAAWIKEKKNQAKPGRLSADEGYCMRCNQAVPLLDTAIYQVSNKRNHKISNCLESISWIIREDRFDSTKKSES